MDLKRLFIEYVMGTCFFMSGLTGAKFQLTASLNDFIIMLVWSTMGWVFYRILVRTVPKDEPVEEDNQDGEDEQA